MRPLNRSMARSLLVVTGLMVTSSASAQTEVSGNAPTASSAADKAIGEYWAIRARYGVAYRTGNQGDQGVSGLSYQGLTPNDLALSAWVWFKYFGVTAGFQREAFALYDTTTEQKVTQGGLIRMHLGPTGRLPLGPVRIEPIVGYALHQLPVFDLSTGVAFGSVARHGILLAARVLVDVGPVTIEARGDFPIGLATTAPPGAISARSSGFSAGGGVRAQLLATGKLHWGLMLDAAYVSDSLTVTDSNMVTTSSAQSVVRGGLSLDVQWRDPVVVVTVGGVLVKVLDAETGAPLSDADVTVEAGGRSVKPTPDSTGALAARELPQGPFTIRATSGGYLPAQGQGEIAAGSDLPLELRLKKEPPKVGSLAVTVEEIDSKKPLAGVTLELGGKTVTTDDAGKATVNELPPGPVAVVATLERYNKAEEAASIIVGKTGTMTITLVPEKQRVPATITGLVRSTKGGSPISANLEVPQVKIKTKANDKGAFTFRVEGGTYTVKVSAPGYLTQTKELSVKDGDQAIFNIDLHPK